MHGTDLPDRLLYKAIKIQTPRMWQGMSRQIVVFK